MRPDENRRGVTLTDGQRLEWLRLIRSDNVGPVAFRQLVNRFGTAGAAIEALPEIAARGGGKRQPKVASLDAAQREMAFAERFGARFVALGEPDYPAALAAADAPPPLLAVVGGTDVLTRSAVGVVGSRNASMAGLKMTDRLVRGIGTEGLTVVSGLARGIDAAAHRASIETGTVACFAGGLDKPFPPENIPLAREIVEADGALVSEMPFGWVPRARDFPRRNRLIAGLSLGTLVVEAALRSGSLITARLANEMGRLVFAVPGSPLDPRAAGTNGLLRQGATLAVEASDIVEALTPIAQRTRGGQHELFEIDSGTDGPAGLDEPEPNERERVVLALGPAPLEVDELIAHLGLPPALVQTVLLELEMAGRLERQAGGTVSYVGS